MPRPRDEGATRTKNAKRKMSKPATQAAEEDLLRDLGKPGLYSSFVHIAQSFIGHDSETATELTRTLNARACKCVGVYRKVG